LLSPNQQWTEEELTPTMDNTDWIQPFFIHRQIPVVKNAVLLRQAFIPFAGEKWKDKSQKTQ